MHLLVKIQEKGTKSMFSDKKTINKVPLMFLELKVLTGRLTMLFVETVTK